MTTLLLDLGEIRDASEDAQNFARLALDERDPEQRRKWQAKARMAMGVVRAKTQVADAAIGEWR